jgi:sugar lactone lactonase YvrE
MKTLDTRMIAEGLVFGEAPRWHNGQLWLSDMLGDTVYSMNADGALEPVLTVPEGPSGLGWLPDGRMLVVSMRNRKLLVASDGHAEVFADLAASNGTPNDMIVDQTGRAYVGNTGCDMFAEGIVPRPTNLLLVADGIVQEVADDLVFPNGMVITPDRRTLIVAETFAHRLTAFDIDPANGKLSNRRIFADLVDKMPDGICMDAEGAIWMASSETLEFLRVREGGEITHRIDTGGRFAAACVTGGPDRMSLYMITAHMTPELFVARQTTARVEVAPLDIAGQGNP